jgi:hypothetical protein
LRRFIPAFFFLFLLVTRSAAGQDNATPPDTGKVDSLISGVKEFPRTYAETAKDTVLSQNPTVALFKSMLVPGLGQIGNKAYIKAGLAISLESVFIGAIVHWAGKTSDAKRAFDNAMDSSLEVRTVLFNTYSDYKSKRNFYSWMLGTTIFLSMFDAYVDAQLSRFPKFKEEKEGLSFQMGPDRPDRFMISLSWKF